MGICLPAGTTTQYAHSDDETQLGQFAWSQKNSGYKAEATGALRANAFGLHDMHGNVWEGRQDRMAKPGMRSRRIDLPGPFPVRSASCAGAWNGHELQRMAIASPWLRGGISSTTSSASAWPALPPRRRKVVRTAAVAEVVRLQGDAEKTELSRVQLRGKKQIRAAVKWFAIEA